MSQCLLIALVLVSSLSLANAQSALQLPTPGPETKLLRNFFPSSETWTGVMRAGALGSGSKEMPTQGHATCRWILNDLYMTCDIEDTAGTGKAAFTWKGVLTVGWDFTAKEYRGSMVDNMGQVAWASGKLTAPSKLLMTTHELNDKNSPLRIRMTWDATDPKIIKYIEEHATQGGSWMVAEEDSEKPAGK